MKEDAEKYTISETVRRRDATLAKMLNTPPSPHAKGSAKKKKKLSKKKAG